MAATRRDRSALDQLAGRPGVLTPKDPGYTAYTGDVVMEGRPECVVRPKTEAEVAELVPFADDHRVSVTVAGGQTSLTGSSVAEEGLLLSTEGMDRLLNLDHDPETGGMTATAEPGILLGDFQRLLEAEGWFYPPDPTSRNEARLGATVATNATGEDTLLYGPTRRWIREVRAVCTSGKVRTLRRPPESRPAREKASPGYLLDSDEIDLLIGSEGTLAVVTRVTVDVIPLPVAVLSGLAFFPSLHAAMAFIVAARSAPGIDPRALEIMDRASLDLVRGNPEGITWPETAGAGVAFKQEYRDEREEQRVLAAWYDLVKVYVDGAPALLDHVLVMRERSDRERLRAFRHRIPSSLNEVLVRRQYEGAGKVGTDWWVPYRELPDFLGGWLRRAEAAGLRTVVFGHAGNGHPHVNFLPENLEEKRRAQALVMEMCREAVAAGGGVAGEHGLGKLKRDLLAVQYSTERIERMRDIKRRWDPHWVLGPGNLFASERGPTTE
jgi:FAD/FMN-containing dehydrogenase